MKKLSLVTLLLVIMLCLPLEAGWAEEENEEEEDPPNLYFSDPPSVVVLPDTPDVYVAPNIQSDLFFWNDWWWLLWRNHWYYSPYYDRGWTHYPRVPDFYPHVNPLWRDYYHYRQWRGYNWHYRHIPYGQLKKQWKTWHTERYWQRKRLWDVERYHPHLPHGGEGLKSPSLNPITPQSPVPLYRQREGQRPYDTPRGDGRLTNPVPGGSPGGGVGTRRFGR